MNTMTEKTLREWDESCLECFRGWTCEKHPRTAWPHCLPNGETCAGPGTPCLNKSCRWRTYNFPGIDAGIKTEMFYLTFGQDHPLRDNWMEIEAKDYDDAHTIATRALGSKFAFLYREPDFKKSYFPGGKVGRTLS